MVRDYRVWVGPGSVALKLRKDVTHYGDGTVGILYWCASVLVC